MVGGYRQNAVWKRGYSQKREKLQRVCQVKNAANCADFANSGSSVNESCSGNSVEFQNFSE
jgi:hypothetical protein